MPENNIQASFNAAAGGAESSGAPAPDGATKNTDTSVKSDGAQGQVGTADAAKGTGAEGQAERTPEKPAPADTKGKEAEQKVAWSEQHLNWLKSKNLDAAAIDPGNASFRQLVENAVQAESAMTKAVQESKAAKAIEDAKKQAQEQQTAPKGPEAPKSPLELFEEGFNGKVAGALSILGFEDVKQLMTERPDLYTQFNEEYRTQRQLAWEESQKWAQDQSRIAEEKAKEKLRVESDYKQMKLAVDTNFQTARAKNPAFDTLWRESGVENILSWLDKTFVLPREMVLQNPEVFSALSEMAAAMEYRRGENDRVKSLREKWEKEALEAKRAKLPSAERKTDVMVEMSQRTIHHGDWRDNLENARIKKG
jgi:hypothetical protein